MKRLMLIAVPVRILLALFLLRPAGTPEAPTLQATPEPTAAATASPEPTPLPAPAPSQTFVTEYPATDYATGEQIVKKLAVYLPEGYIPGKSYPAVMLMHVSGADETFWLNLGIQEIMDELTANGEIPPTLVFMPDGYAGEEKRGARNDPGIYTQFAAELRNDLMPFLREYYGISENRGDLAFYGASFGAYLCVNSVLIPNLDLFSGFGYVGGGTIDLSSLLSGWEDSGTAGLPIKLLYIGEGSFDDRGPVELSYLTLLNHCDSFSDANLKFSLMENVGHDPEEWTRGLREFLPLFFSSEG